MSIRDSVRRIPWKEYFRKQILKIVGLVILVLMLLLIIDLSTSISPNRDEINPDNVIGFDQPVYWYIIIVSSTLFIFTVLIFTKLILFDNKEEFGITTYKSYRAAILVFLVFSFLTIVYILLDSSLINVYLITGPVDLIYILDNNYGLNFPGVTDSVDRLAYSQIRSLYFTIFFVALIIFPVVMFFLILTRLGRNRLFKRKQEVDETTFTSQFLKSVLFIITPFIEIFLLSLIFSIQNITSILVVFIFIGLALWWIYQVFKLVFRTVKFTTRITYANILLILPVIIIFYILPVLMWTIWDMFKIYFSNGRVLETIHDRIIQSDLHGQILNISSFTIMDHFQLLLKTLFFNATPLDHSIFRILQADFIIIVGIAALVIGLAEGYSIVAIVTALSKGISIGRTGRIATRTSPKIIVFTSRFLMLSVWISFLWDKFLSLFYTIKEEFPDIILPDISFLPIISYMYQIMNELIVINSILLPLAILLIPLFVILISSFKFLSVTLVLDRLKQDIQVFFLLISSAFILISTEILSDIVLSYENDPQQIQYMPFAFATADNLLSWASKIIEILEAVAFYVGFGIAILVAIKMIIAKIRGRKEKSITPTIDIAKEEPSLSISGTNNLHSLKPLDNEELQENDYLKLSETEKNEN